MIPAAMLQESLKIMKKLKKLDTVEAVCTLPAGTLVYVTDKKATPPLVNEPMLVTHVEDNNTERAIFVDTKCRPWGYTTTYCHYGKDWWVKIEDGFTVETSDGTLHAYESSDPKHSSIMVNLLQPGNNTPITLMIAECSKKIRLKGGY